MAEHVKLHGPDRFTCNLCNFNAPSNRAIGHHMKIKHDIVNLEYIPVHKQLTDMEKDEFIVFGDETQQSAQKILRRSFGFKCGECALTSVERKSIILHMRDIHNIDQFETCVVNSPFNVNFVEEYEIRKMNSTDLQSADNQISTKRKRHSNCFNVSDNFILLYNLLFKIK